MTALTSPRAVIFDWDNTLVDSWGCILAAMNATLVRMGHRAWGLEEAKQKVALSLRDSFPALFGDRWEEARDIFYESFEAIHIHHLRPLPQAEELLHGLLDRGVALAVVSNKNGRFLRQEAQHLGWDKLFVRLVGATDAEADKPARAPVELALKDTGIAPGPHVWFVGDADVDIHCAHNADCTPILMRTDPMRPGEFDRHAPLRHLPGCNELLSLVNELYVPITPI